MKNYGEAFQYFRKLNGYSLEYAAADSISKSQLSRFERGENEFETVPRHREINEITAKGILRKWGIK